jgi:hypothetical protein
VLFVHIAYTAKEGRGIFLMKLRIYPTLITVLVTGVLLFGGWYLYRSFAIEQPLSRIISDVNGVSSSKPVIGRDTVTVKLQLKQGTDIRDVYHRISTDSASIIGGRQLKIDINQTPDPNLERLWSSMLFQVAEGMEKRTYSEIPKALSLLEAQNEGLKASTQMDETNVYITLQNGQAVKYIVLPRIPETIGVWPNA